MFDVRMKNGARTFFYTFMEIDSGGKQTKQDEQDRTEEKKTNNKIIHFLLPFRILANNLHAMNDAYALI